MTHFRISNWHADLPRRDAKHVFGWRYHPLITFKGVRMINIDANEYYDLSSSEPNARTRLSGACPERLGSSPSF